MQLANLFALLGDQTWLQVLTALLYGDVGASVAVIVAGLIILLTGWTPADSSLSVGIAGLIAAGA